MTDVGAARPTPSWRCGWPRRPGRGLRRRAPAARRAGRPPVAGDGRRRHGQPALPRRRARPGCGPTTPCCPRRASRIPRRFGGDRVWIIDPLDGTREFGEPGRVDWAVHVALWAGGPSSPAPVSLPALGPRVRHRPAAGPAAVRPGPAAPRHVAEPRAVRRRARRPRPRRRRRAARVGRRQGDVRRHRRADIYVHDGGMYQWDSAAPAAVALAAGLHVSRIDGSPLVYNAPRPVAARLPRLPAGAGRPRARRAVGLTMRS